MKGGSILCWRTVVGVVGSTYPGIALVPGASVGFWESRVEWPCSVGIRSERVEAVGAAGRTTWIAVVGEASETSARRGSAVYPSCARLGASRPPQHVQVETTCRRVGEPHRTAVWLKDGVRILERVNFGKKITGGGSKLFGRKITQALTPLHLLAQGSAASPPLPGSANCRSTCPFAKQPKERPVWIRRWRKPHPLS